MENRVKFFIVGVLISTFCDDCLTLKEIKIYVPTAVVQGHKAILKCIFDLESDKLYALKWYRGAGEFYRYTPSESNPIKQFKIKGFHVVETESNETQVVLEDVSRAISGPFTCEVTADQPSFFTDMKTADLEVVELPKRDPYITGLKNRYRIGDVLRANCTSEKSNPAANVSWYVNGQHIDGPHVHRYKYEDGEYITTYATLRMKVTEQMFVKGRLKIRCSASMHSIYHRSSEKSVEVEKKRHRTFHPWTATTTTTTDAPLGNSLYMEANLPPDVVQTDSRLIFYSPMNSHASRVAFFYESTLLVPVCILFVLYR